MPRTVLALSSPFRRIVGRVFLFIGMFCPGFLITFFAHTWAKSIPLHAIGSVPHAFFGLGIFLLVGSVMILRSKSRDFGYIVGAIFWFIILFGAITSLFSENHVSALAFSLPVIVWIYAESAITASRSQENTKNKNEPRG